MRIFDEKRRYPPKWDAGVVLMLVVLPIAAMLGYEIDSEDPTSNFNQGAGITNPATHGDGLQESNKGDSRYISEPTLPEEPQTIDEWLEDNRYSPTKA